jgi:Cys/Met metabolism PLP-dependent enzyme
MESIRDIAYYAKKAHAVGAKLGIDATFAPPPLQNPLKWGADIIMHSGRYSVLPRARSGTESDLPGSDQVLRWPFRLAGRGSDCQD